MPNRPPPALGSYRPSLVDQPEPGGPAPDDLHDNAFDGVHEEDLPRVVTQRPALTAGPRQGLSQGSRARRQQLPTRRSIPVADDGGGMSLGRLAAYSGLGVLAFIAASALAAFLLLPTTLIRDRLQLEVKARTGRDLVIAGGSSVSLWPSPAVTVRDVTLSSPASMGSEPLITAAEIEVAVQILPLLLHDVTIDRLVLRRPRVDLRIDAQGRRSWDFAAAGGPVRLAQASLPPGAPGQMAAALPKELQEFLHGSTAGANDSRAGKLRLTDLSLGNVSIADGTVRYRDARSGLDETVTALNAQFSLANMARPLDARAYLVWRGEPVQVSAQVQPVRALLEGRPVQATLKSIAAPLQVSYTGALIPGGKPGEPPDLDGHLTASVVSLDRFVRWIGYPIGGTPAGGMSIDTKLKRSAAGMALADARLAVGSLSGTGALNIDTHGARPLVTGAVRVAALDLNMMQALTEAAPSAPSAPAGTPGPPSTDGASPPPQSIDDLLKIEPSTEPTKPQVRGFLRREGWSDDAINLQALGMADGEVRVSFDSILWHDTTTGPGQSALFIRDGVARVTLDDVQLYDGHAHGMITLDGRTADAVISGNVVADGVSALPFLKAVGGFDWLSGRARTSLAFAGRGQTERQIMSTLNGKADISVAEGALEGLNLSTILHNLAQGKFGGFDRVPTERTAFSAFAASAQIANGIARNDDLRITSADVRATGAGTINLPERTMDYLLHAKVTTGGASLDIPLSVTGSIDKPTVTPQLGGLLRDPKKALQAVEAVANTPAGREVRATVDGLIKGDPQARAKVKSFFDQLIKP